MGQPASTSTAPEVLGGLEERVTFHNEENGFCVLGVRYFETELFPDPSR
jgi:hypothetical protein